jgi:hypothetical protein
MKRMSKINFGERRITPRALLGRLGFIALKKGFGNTRQLFFDSPLQASSIQAQSLFVLSDSAKPVFLSLRSSLRYRDGSRSFSLCWFKPFSSYFAL